ncbi:sorbosone dehydrogenase family protein [bacterium]|nr:MAG: sorbosone dehydrogenase family protein [bacterium]
MKKTTPFILAFVFSAYSVLPSCGLLAGKLPSFTSPESGIKEIKLPPGFRIEIFARDVAGARSITLTPDGTLFVGTRGTGKVYALQFARDGKHQVYTVASGLHDPNGVAFKDGSLYVAEISRILRYDNIAKSLRKPPQAAVVTDALPDKEAHGWKFIRFGPDGKLYVPVGMPCNICEQEDKRFGTIMRCNPDGSELEIYASGIRNTVGFDWHPQTRELWFTENGRDRLGDDIPPDELNRAPKKGMHFGFPYCYGKGRNDPDFKGAECEQYTPAELELGPHVAALGMRFYTGSMFPSQYRGGIFIAEHGSWNRSSPIGYRIMFVRLENGKAASYDVFAEGWLQGGFAWGRPVDVEVMPDGALLVSDDKADAIYRISYKEQ